MSVVIVGSSFGDYNVFVSKGVVFVRCKSIEALCSWLHRRSGTTNMLLAVLEALYWRSERLTEGETLDRILDNAPLNVKLIYLQGCWHPRSAPIDVLFWNVHPKYGDRLDMYRLICECSSSVVRSNAYIASFVARAMNLSCVVSFVRGDTTPRCVPHADVEWMVSMVLTEDVTWVVDVNRELHNVWGTQSSEDVLIPFVWQTPVPCLAVISWCPRTGHVKYRNLDFNWKGRRIFPEQLARRTRNAFCLSSIGNEHVAVTTPDGQWAMQRSDLRKWLRAYNNDCAVSSSSSPTSSPRILIRRFTGGLTGCLGGIARRVCSMVHRSRPVFS